MGNKEIYIDGVDVAGCSLYLKDNGKCLRLLTDNEPETECNAICDYGCLYCKEQLARLEQENNSLQAQINNITVQSNNAITALEQENKALRAYKDVNEDFKKAWDELNKKYKQLRSVLEEIRKECKCYGRQRGSNRIFDREYGGELHINIIEQINEVLE